MSASSLGHFPLSQLPPPPKPADICGLNGAFTEELSHRLLPIGVHLCMRGVGVEEGVCLKQLILKNNPAGGLIMCFGAKEFEQKKKKTTLRSWPLSCPTPCLIFSFGNSQMTHSGCFDKTFSCFFPPHPQASVI